MMNSDLGLPNFLTIWRTRWNLDRRLLALIAVLRTLRTRWWPRSVPVMHQLSTTECGVTCLAMLLRYFGYPVSLADCRAACGSGRDGLSAQVMLTAARSLGLHGKAYRLAAADCGQLPLPAIVHWKSNHFVVVERVTSKRVTLVDPAVGRQRLTLAEFAADFSGVALTFAPGDRTDAVGRTATLPAQERVAQQPVWRDYLAKVLRIPGLGGLLGQIVGASLLLQLLGLALPLMTQLLVDRILPQQMRNAMAILGIGIVVLVLSQSVTGYLRAVLLLYLQGRLDSRLMVGFFEHVLSLPFGFFQQRNSGDMLMRLSSTVVIRELLTSQTLATLLDGLFVLAYLAILLVQAPRFGLFALGIGLLQMVLLLASNRRVHELTQRDLAAQAASQNYLVEALSGIATVKAFGAEERALAHWSTLFYTHLNASLQRNHLAALLDNGLGALRTAAPLILLWFGALRVLDGSMTLGAMLALNALAAAFLAPLASLATNGRQFQLAGAHLDRLLDLLAAQAEQDPQHTAATPRLSGQIELRNVSFRYDPHGPWILRNISATIKPGQTIALVGATASGKSTLAQLLLGLYLPTEGEILYDGIPIQGLNYRQLRRQWGVVLQEPFLFSGSIRQNISLNDPATPLAHIADAAQQAGIHAEIMQMPMGYETIVGERGSGFSGGQCQRIALARALVHRPTMVLLDEATSHLDRATEHQIDRQLAALSCTRIIIAHRLSTIRNADMILVINGGEIVERGSHDTLLAQGGRYAELVGCAY